MSPYRRNGGSDYRTDVTSDEILARDPVCVMCGAARSAEAHHRRFRSQGGWDTWANLIGLCVRCHVPRAHQGNRVTMEALGYVVPRRDNPVTVSVQYHGRGLVILGLDGSINAAPPRRQPRGLTRVEDL